MFSREPDSLGRDVDPRLSPMTPVATKNSEPNARLRLARQASARTGGLPALAVDDQRGSGLEIRWLSHLPPCDSAAAGGPFVPRAVAIRPPRKCRARPTTRSLRWNTDGFWVRHSAASVMPYRGPGPRRALAAVAPLEVRRYDERGSPTIVR
jgi:hypothetical protein